MPLCCHPPDMPSTSSMTSSCLRFTPLAAARAVLVTISRTMLLSLPEQDTAAGSRGMAGQTAMK